MAPIDLIFLRIDQVLFLDQLVKYSNDDVWTDMKLLLQIN